MLAPLVLAAMTAALVVEDQTPLRLEARGSAPMKAELARGDWLEVRGEEAGFLKVYDHRRERPGWVRAWRVRRYPLEASSAPALRAVIELLRDSPGFESLGLGYAALYLRVAPASALDGGVFDAIGVMADRLARRASARGAWAGPATPRDPRLAAQLEVARSYGAGYHTIEREGAIRLCYDGEAFRRVLALAGSSAEAAERRVRAALALTRDDCLPQAAGPLELRAWNEWRLTVLAQADPTLVPPHVAGLLGLRRAEALAMAAFDQARQGHAKEAAAAAAGAVAALARVDRRQLTEEAGKVYDRAAVRVAASRWAAEPAPAAPKGGAPRLELRPGQPGETCVQLVEGAGAKARRLFERCTYGQVWPSSFRLAPRGRAAVVAVQVLPAWTELWLLRPGAGGWDVHVLTPAVAAPEAGYVEAAGFSPDGTRLLVAREASVKGRLTRRFEIRRLDSLAVVLGSSSLDRMFTFKRWAAPSWRGGTLATR